MDFRAIQQMWLLLALFVAVCIILRQHYLMAATSLYATTASSSAWSCDIFSFDKGPGQEESKGQRSVLSHPSHNWIVLDATATPCHDVTVFTQQDDWKVLVVTDVRTNIIGCQLENCMQLTWKNIQMHLSRFTTTRLHGRPAKIFGFLYVIMNGAEVIVDGDCSAGVGDISNSFRLSEIRASGLWYNDSQIFNPFSHWGLAEARPIGLGGPLQNGGFSETELKSPGMFYVSDFGRIPIRQAVTISNRTCTRHPKIKHDVDVLGSQSSPVILEPRSFAFLGTGATVFFKEAFWWMFSPFDLDLSTTILFRNLWIHEMRRLTNINIGYYSTPVMVNKIANVSKPECNSSPGNVTANMTHLIDCVQSKRCVDDSDPIECSIAIAYRVMTCLRPNDTSAKEKMAALQAWMEDLLLIGLPVIQNSSAPNENVFKIKYGFNLQKWGQLNAEMNKNSSLNPFKNASSLCSKNGMTALKIPSEFSHPVIRDVLLIVIINYESLFGTIPYMEYIHRQYFQHILYCGPAVDHFVQYANAIGLTYVTYLDGMTSSWLFMYECVTHAMKLRLPVKGYLQMGEDVLLNTWNLVNLPRDHIWMPEGFTTRHLYTAKREKNWVHWNSEIGQKAAIGAFSELKSASSLPPDKLVTPNLREFHLFAKRFLSNYKSNFKMDYIIHRATDIFYIPDVLRQDYIKASELFRQHRSLIEIALPVMHLGLARKSQITYISGHSLWREDRNRPWQFFNAVNRTFIHPFKLLFHSKSPEGLKFFCHVYMTKYRNARDEFLLAG
ncbi:unnamed protein product [Lymnaea stagnalis]|uniref:Uncharacterized protein n=1 Tax=Lymnaea stagnalis TaxID=6523 RepID=A0AAV2H6D6_LYMST